MISRWASVVANEFGGMLVDHYVGWRWWVGRRGRGEVGAQWYEHDRLFGFQSEQVRDGSDQLIRRGSYLSGVHHVPVPVNDLWAALGPQTTNGGLSLDP